MEDTIYKKLAETNSREYNLLKAAEELNELSLVLIQLVNKPNKVKEQEVIDEIGDVCIRIKVLKHLFNRQSISKRILFKTNNFKRYLEEDKYKGKI